VLVPGAIGADESIDLPRLLAAGWRHRWVFLATLLLTSIPLLAWAMRGVPPISASVVVAPATTGLGTAGTSPIVSLGAMAAFTNEIVIERLKAMPGSSPEVFPFAALKAEAVVPTGAEFLRIDASGRADAAPSLKAFLDAAVALLSSEQQGLSDRLRQELDQQIEQHAAMVDALRLAERMSTPGSVEQAQIGLDLARQETRLQNLGLQQALMLPTRELRPATIDTSAAVGWRTRRIGVAALAAVAAAVAAMSVAALAEGVRRHASRP